MANRKIRWGGGGGGASGVVFRCLIVSNRFPPLGVTAIGPP